MSNRHTEKKAPQDKTHTEPNDKNPDDKNGDSSSPTGIDNGAQSADINTELDIDNTISSLRYMLRYFLNLKERSATDSQSRLHQASPVKKRDHERRGGPTKSTIRNRFAKNGSGDNPFRLSSANSNFKHSESNRKTLCASDDNANSVSNPANFSKDLTQSPTTEASVGNSISSEGYAKREFSPFNSKRFLRRNQRKRKNKISESQDTNETDDAMSTDQSTSLSSKNVSSCSQKYKNTSRDDIPRAENINCSQQGNSGLSGNNLPCALVEPNIHGDSVQNSLGYFNSGRSLCPDRGEETSIYPYQNSALATNVPVQDNSNMVLDLYASQIPASSTTPNLRQWDLSNYQVGVYDTINVPNAESQQFEPFHSVNRMQSFQVAPRYLYQYMPILNVHSFAPNSSLSPYFSYYYASQIPNTHLGSNVVQQYRSSYRRNSYGTLYNQSMSSTNLFWNSIWNAPQEDSNHLNNDAAFPTPSNNSGWNFYP